MRVKIYNRIVELDGIKEDTIFGLKAESIVRREGSHVGFLVSKHRGMSAGMELRLGEAMTERYLVCGECAVRHGVTQDEIFKAVEEELPEGISTVVTCCGIFASRFVSREKITWISFSNFSEKEEATVDLVTFHFVR